ncbi:MAG TPA: DUF3987 domain-containing protein [Lysobacter sp.]
MTARIFAASLFESVTAAEPKMLIGTPTWWADLLSKHVVLVDKKLARALSMAIYREGGRRMAADIVGADMIAFDVDSGVPFREVRGRLGALAFTTWTTFSSTPDFPRWRLLLFLSRRVSPAEYGRVVDRLAEQLGLTGRLDPCSRKIAQLHFLPSAPPGAECHARCRAEGELVDVDAALAASPPRLRLIQFGASVVQPASDEEIQRVRDALAFIAADQYAVWIEVGQALHAGGVPLEIWESWSARSGKYQPGVCAQRWAGFHADGGLTLATVFARAKAAGWHPRSSADAVADPEPLTRPMEPPQPFPLDALGPVLEPVARRIAQVVQAPDALIASSLLAGASLAAQAHADVVVDGRREPLSLWFLSVSESGERKTAADNWAVAEHRRFERDQLGFYREAEAEHATDLAAFTAASRSAARGKKTRAVVQDSLRELGKPPPAPMLPWLLLADPTIEGLHRQLREGRPSQGLFNSDAGDFFGGYGMSDDHRTKSAAALSRLWDDGELVRTRGGDGHSKLYGRRLAAHLMVQPVVFEMAVAADDVLARQGFLARALICWPISMAGTRQYVEADLSTDSVIQTYWRHIKVLLSTPYPLRPETTNELEPPALTLSADAKARWIVCANVIEADMAGPYAQVKAWASKAPAQILRMAGVLTLLENPHASEVQVEAIERAALLVAHYLGEACRIIGTAVLPVETRHAMLLLDWCRDTGRDRLYSSAALRLGPNAIRHKEAFDEAMKVLERAGWAIPLLPGVEVDGRQRRRAWSIRIEASP